MSPRSPLDRIDLDALLSPEARRSPEMEAAWRFIQTEDAKLPDQSRMSIAQQRAVRDQASLRWNSELPEVANVARIAVPGLAEAPDIACDLIVPHGAEPGCIVYFHGGGWVFGGLASHARMARMLATSTNTRVLAVDYRLAPENPFPAGLDDCVAAWRYVAKRASADAGFAGPLGVAGDSAGANLGLALILREGETGRRTPDLGLLFYGVWGCDFDTPSYARFGVGHGLSKAGMEAFLDMYAPGGDDPGALRFDPLVSPLLASEASLAKMPPLYLNGAGMDPLMSDTIGLARKLEAAGALYDMNVHPGVHHGFMQMTGRLDEARRAFDLAAEFWRSHSA